MKVLMINGSPHENGCTFTALTEIANELSKHGIDSKILSIGKADIHGCIACGQCKATGRCIYTDIVDEVVKEAQTADGFIFGSPVYYASPNGSMISLMDRAFYSASKLFKYKPAAVVCSARRGGTTATYDCLNKYIGINNMIMVPSQYWNMVHGNKPEDVLKDEEGLQIMRNLARNMVWLLNLIENGKKNGITPPEGEQKITTSFIR